MYPNLNKINDKLGKTGREGLVVEGFEIFFYIIFGVTVLIVIASMFSKRILPDNKYDKYISIGIVGLPLISLAIIIISFFVGGWSGM